jgi:outer membrane protein assembly factor BamA
MKKPMLISFMTALFTLLSINESISQQYYFIRDITIIGNKKTDINTIFKELPFERGDLIEASSLETLMEIGEENLNNLSLFNFVEVYHSEFSDIKSKYQDIAIFIDLQERWYYWPIVSMTLEGRNLSSWIKEPEWNKITLESGFRIDNIAGKNQTLKALLTSGYNKGFMFEYSNIHLDRKGRHLLGINLTRLYSRTENVTVMENAPFYIKSDTTFLTSKYSATLAYTYRPRLRLRHKIEMAFVYAEIEQSVLDFNPHYWGSDDLERRGYSIKYSLIADQRDNIQYPLDGHYIKTSITGFSDNKFNIRRTNVEGDFRIYGKIKPQLFYSVKTNIGISKSNVEAYLFNRAIGYNNINLRGYEYYVADGQHYFVISPTIKYNILPDTRFNIGFLSFIPQFSNIHFALYAKAFSDIGYAFHNNPTQCDGLSNKLLHSWGVGLDIAAYYDITISADLSMNKLGDCGFYISFLTPVK